MGQCGLYLDTTWEVAPDVVRTTIAAAWHLYDARTAEIAAVVVPSNPVVLLLVSWNILSIGIGMHQYKVEISLLINMGNVSPYR